MGFEGDKMHIPVAFRFSLCLSIRLKHLQNTMRLKKKNTTKDKDHTIGMTSGCIFQMCLLKEAHRAGTIKHSPSLKTGNFTHHFFLRYKIE